MTKLDTLFQIFLTNIEPDKDAVAYAMEAHKPLRQFLEEDKIFGDYFVNSFLYGSYKRHTAVGTIKDVDIVIITNFNPDSNDHTPQIVLRKLKSALARYYDDPKNPKYQRRSIRIDQPLPDRDDCEMTLDIIPAVAIDGEDNPLMVPDREVKEWIASHPKGHINYSSELNSENNGRFIHLVKIMKWWWSYQCKQRQPEVRRPKPKGFWIEVLTGSLIDPAQHYYADYFITLLESISKKYSGIDLVPELPDPGLDDDVIKTNMEIDEFNIFMEAVNESLTLAKDAREEICDLESSRKWQEIFGKEKFPLYNESTEATKSSSMRLGNYSHALSPPWPENQSNRYIARIRAVICDPDTGKFVRQLRNDGDALSPNQLLKFFLETDVPGDYTIKWQVVNTGEHAKNSGGLRGKEFFKGKDRDQQKINPNPKHNFEKTLYTGKHWIQCFVLVNGMLVAKSDRFFVNVFNPDFPKP